MSKKFIVLLTALMLTISLCSCANQTATDPPESEPIFQEGIARLPKLEELEATELLKYTDGVIEVEYDGNVFVPVSITEINTDLYELVFGDADITKEDTLTFGYFLYGPGSYDIPDVEEIYNEEIRIYLTDPETSIVKTEDYREKTESEIYRIFEWEEGDVHGYGLLAIRNNEGDCVVAQFFSESEEIIRTKVIPMMESFKMAEVIAYDETICGESFARTEAIYEKFYPEEMEAFRQDLAEQEQNAGAYLDAPEADELTDNTANGKVLSFTDVEVSLISGDEYDLTLIGTALEDGVEYVTSNPEVVTTDQNGHIVAVAPGDAAIIAYTDYGAIAKAYVYVAAGEGDAN